MAVIQATDAKLEMAFISFAKTLAHDPLRNEMPLTSESAKKYTYPETTESDEARTEAPD
jgi:hypothetical protein